MTKRTRTIILAVCVLLFVVIAPLIILYSMGYRFDFKTRKIVETGGIYVRTFPSADQILVDGKNTGKPGFFSGGIFVQNLLPDEAHSVVIKKAGYLAYTKTLPVEEEEVTKLENVILFKKNIAFTPLATAADSPFLTLPDARYSLKNNSLFYAAVSANAKPSATVPVIKNVLAFMATDSQIIWLATTGMVYQSDLDGKNQKPLSNSALPITKKGTYALSEASGIVTVNHNGQLELINSNDSFAPIAQNVQDQSVSPDGRNIAYASNQQIHLISADNLSNSTILYNAGSSVSNLQWLNNDYIMFTDGNNIVISEIDSRGNVNTVTIPSPLQLSDDTTLPLKNPQLLFDTSSNVLWVTSGTTVTQSEKLF